MRPLAIGLILGSLLVALGCVPGWSPYRPPPPPPPPPGKAPDSEALLNYLRGNSEKFRSLQVQTLDLDIKQARSGPVPGLRGWLVCEKPRNFRLAGDAIGQPQVDLGSNGKEFWFWIAKADKPYVYHCSYDDLTRGVRLAFPFQPEWVVEALGMTTSGTAATCEVKETPTTYELVERATSLQGQPVRKVTVFHKSRVAPPQSQIVARRLEDATGKIIASARIERAALDRGDSGVIYPQILRLEYPAEQVEIKLTLDRVLVNVAIDAERAESLFTRKNLSDKQSFDLARGLESALPTANSNIRPAGGLFRR